jgi:hypothetical protein
MRPRLDMMMIPINPKRAFENGIISILLHHNPRPPNIRPFRARPMLQ